MTTSGIYLCIMRDMDQKESLIRLDKWLWAARFFKTRSLAHKQIGLGRIKVNGVMAKASKYVTVGDIIEMNHHGLPYRFTIKELSNQRKSAQLARFFYEEDTQIVKEREEIKQQQSLSGRYVSARFKEKGRPTKKNRRRLEQIKWEMTNEG